MIRPRHGSDDHTDVEIDYNWIPMSVEQIRRSTFRETQMARRGIRSDDVHAFVGRVAHEIEQWRLRCERERNETKRLTNWYRDHGVDISIPHRRQITLEATQILINAQRQADQVIAEAHVQARHVQSDATAHAETIIEHARAGADRAAQQYRAEAGDTYTAEREEIIRLRNWGESILLLLRATQSNVGIATDELARILGDATIEQMPDRPPATWSTPSPFNGVTP